MNEIRYIDGLERPEEVKQIYREYSKIKGAEVCFLSFEEELQQLSSIYSKKGNRILLACIDDNVAGCVAVKKIDAENCELKRLYVRPEYRNQRIGQNLVEKILEFASSEAYQKIQLYTLPNIMDNAIRLYHKLDFHNVDLNNNVLHMEKSI